MEQQKQSRVYAATALFDSADAVYNAASKTAEAGYSKYDVHTPYPVHGMDKAMRLRPSRIGIWTLIFGVMGTTGIMAFITWVTLIDYPLVIGGKPFWSWPAFVPVAFEFTVLTAVLLTVATLIVVYFKFPNLSHPLHDTAYMKAVSRDKFGVAILATDPLFDEKKTVAFLQGLGGTNAALIVVDIAELEHGQKIFNLKFVGALVAVAIITSASTYLIFNKLFYLPPFNWMMTQERLMPQKPTTFFPDGSSMRPPVKGTVARGIVPYAYHGKPAEAAHYLVNPLEPTGEVITRGKQKYLTFCSPCHGNFGDGDSRLRGQFPNPPSLHTEKIRTLPDGGIFHIITEGQNVMPAYASQIKRDDRWAIVHYIRVLERAKFAKESDLK